MNKLKVIAHAIIIAALLWLALALSGCSFKRGSLKRVDAQVLENDAAIEEESKAMTTGVVDALHVAPSNAPTALALDLATRDQQLEGLPVKRLDVNALLDGELNALRDLRERQVLQHKLVAERAELENRLKEAEGKLIEMGKLYEAEKNKSIVKRIWAWTISTLGVGGVIALCIFCPAVIPIIGQLFGWLVSKIPALAGMLGVVSKKAFDGVVKGVGNAREQLKQAKKEEELSLLNTELSKSTDTDHRRLIESRRLVLNV